ncbi:MAG: Protein translocase subunit SecA, partial [Candidatus Moranbacteria bacterium GW2011_GWF2_34_56]
MYHAQCFLLSIETENLKEVSRKDAYNADITYGTNNEFGFDYLRDNMASRLEDMNQRKLHYAIVDEVDSILIDEARTPLIISAPDTESTKLYQQFAQIIPRLKIEEDYKVDEKERHVSLTEAGISKVEKFLNIDNLYEPGKITYVHHLEQSLKAEVLFKREKDYIVKDGQVIIVDDFTGRLMEGRRYSEGLHQAIEAKEGVAVQRESRTLATITFQNYFRIYKKLAGMTGTALTSAEEFAKVYKLDVMEIPTHKKMMRKDLADIIYKTEKGKFDAIARDIKKISEKGQPILVGTIAIEKSEYLSNLLNKEGIKHEVLNAKQHEREAGIIADAGKRGSITIATNMAGRGTDIKLGEGVRELGGLVIIGSERHEARRIDNQLRGRAGRQGDPGVSQFYVSLEDELMRRFGGDKMKNIMDKLKLPEDQPIQNAIISKTIESAQSKIEGFNFDIRKHVLDYD